MQLSKRFRIQAFLPEGPQTMATTVATTTELLSKVSDWKQGGRLWFTAADGAEEQVTDHTDFEVLRAVQADLVWKVAETAAAAAVQADPIQESAVAAALQLAATVLEPICQKLTTAVDQLQPRSYAASSIGEGALQEFRRKANVQLLEVHSDTAWEDLMDKNPEPDGFDWQAGTSEPLQADRYVPFWKERLQSAATQLQLPFPAGLTIDKWRRVDNMAAIRFRHKSCPFFLSSKNDMVLMGSFYESAVIGVEFKTNKDFKEQAVRQGEVELYTWDSIVTYPFLQVVTDLGRGGIAYWCSEAPLQGSSPIIIKRQVLGSMRKVYEFVARAVHRLPDNMVQRLPDEQGNWIPQQLPEPDRVKIFKSEPDLAAVHEGPEEMAISPGGSSSGGGGPSGSTPDHPDGRQASQHSAKQEQSSKFPGLSGQAGSTSARNKQMLCYLEVLLANVDDVANMRDVDEFD